MEPVFEGAANALHAAIVRHLTTPRLVVLVVACALTYVAAVLCHGEAGVGAGSKDFWSGFPRVGVSFFAGLLIHRCRSRLPILPRAGWLSLPAFVVAIVVAGYTGSLVVELATVLAVAPLCVIAAAGARAAPRMLRLTDLAAEVTYPIYAVQAPMIVLGGWLLGPFGTAGVLPIALWTSYAGFMVLVAFAVGRVVDAPVRTWLTRRLRPRRFDTPFAV